MAESGPEPLPLDRERLEAQPQRLDVWQVDARQSATAFPTGDRPWVTVIVSRTDDHVLALDEALEDLANRSTDPAQPGMLATPGVTPEAVASFFDAALFYEQAPWDKTGERPIQVECGKFEGGPWYAVVMGASGMTRGLILYDDLETLKRVQQGDLPEVDSARRTAALAVVFGPKEDLPAADIEAVERHGWRVAGANAYPWVYRMEPGLVMRPPLVWELELLEACLRAIPEFVRKKTRRLAPLTLTVPVASGELQLVLLWAAG